MTDRRTADRYHHLIPVFILCLTSAAGIWLYLVGTDPDRADDLGLGYQFKGLRTYRLASSDTIFKWRNMCRKPRHYRVHPDVVLLDIDDASLDFMNEWPPNRKYYASALSLLQQAKLVGFDIFLSEPGHAKLGPKEWQTLRSDIGRSMGKLLNFEIDREEFIEGIAKHFESPDILIAQKTEEIKNAIWSSWLWDYYFGEAHLHRERQAKQKLAYKIYREAFRDRALYKRWVDDEHNPEILKELFSKAGIPYAESNTAFHRDLNLIKNELKKIDRKNIVSNLSTEFHPDIDQEKYQSFLFDADFRARITPEICRKFNFLPEQIIKGWRIMTAEFLFTNLDLAMQELGSDNPLPVIDLLMENADLKQAYPRVSDFKELHALLTDSIIEEKLPAAGEGSESLITTYEMTQPIYRISRVSKMPAFAQISPDDDGIVRSYPMVMRYHDRLVPSLSLAMACAYYDVPFKSIQVEPGKYITIPVKDKPIRIPIDKRGRIKINWQSTWNGDFDFPHYSFADILKTDESTGQLTDKAQHILDMLRGKAVIIGLTATGTHDFNPMPLQARYPMVGAHANILNNILNQDFIPHENRPLAIAAIMIAVMLTGGCASLTNRIMVNSMLLILTMVGHWLLCVLLFHKYNIQLTAVEPMLSGFAAFTGIVLYRFFTEERAKKKTEQMFGTMVSHDVLDYMKEHPESFALTGEKREATIFFSDVSGFTTIAESQTAEGLALVLNRYLTPMSDIIMKYNGYIDKYEGDAIMADFGVPVWNDADPHSHAWKACWAAIEQQQTLNTEVAPAIEQEFGVKLTARMGINSGTVSAGNMGSKQRFQYTVMGDAVNQAARFEPANKSFGTRIMIGEPTYELAKDKIEARFLTLMLVKGKTEPVRTYELIAKKGDISERRKMIIAMFQEGWDLHAQRKWPEAIIKFSQVLAMDPDDGPSNAYIELCQNYMDNPPGESWAGEWIQTTK